MPRTMKRKTEYRLDAGKGKIKIYQQRDVIAAAVAANKQEVAGMHNAPLIAETREVTMGEAEPEPRDVEPANIEDHYQFFAMLPTSTPRALLFLSCVPGAAQCNTLSCHFSK